jgi:hypothetical protein
VIAGHRDDGSALRSGWDSEPVLFALDDEHREPHLVELGEAALRRLAPGPSRRLQGEGQAEHRDRARRLRRAAGDARAEGPAADDQRQAGQLLIGDALEDRDPGGIELPCGRGRAAAGDPVRLLDERDGEPLRASDVRRGHDVPRRHAARGAVAEDERGRRILRGVEVDPGLAVRRFD